MAEFWEEKDIKRKLFSAVDMCILNIESVCAVEVL
jgi:hypothetical protein